LTRKRKLLLVAGLLVVAGGVGATVAFATAPSGQTGVLLARGTADVTLGLDEPKVVTVTKKVRVRVKVRGKYKYVTRTKTTQQTVQSPVVACGASTQCDVAVQKITYAPGGFSGWHSHPGVVFGVIASGSIVRYLADCTKQTYTAGQTFTELGSNQTVYVRNEGTTAAEIYATLVVPKGADLRVDQAQPSSCSP
jgi:quercetin dioxygenase-like cupin family protein